VIDPATLHRRAASGFGTLVHGITDDQWARPTPCGDWDVRALVAHVVDEQLWTAPLLEGGTIAEVTPAIPADPLGADPAKAWDTSVHDAVEGVGHTDLAAIVHLSFGDFPAEEYVMQLFADMLVHGWDLARATGQVEHLDNELVTECTTWFDKNEEAYRGAGVFGDALPVPATADPQTRLLARFGRA